MQGPLQIGWSTKSSLTLGKLGAIWRRTSGGGSTSAKVLGWEQARCIRRIGRSLVGQEPSSENQGLVCGGPGKLPCGVWVLY